ncbi:hypothetical protein, partial [Xanthomonas translucens]
MGEAIGLPRAKVRSLLRRCPGLRLHHPQHRCAGRSWRSCRARSGAGAPASLRARVPPADRRRCARATATRILFLPLDRIPSPMSNSFYIGAKEYFPGIGRIAFEGKA